MSASSARSILDPRHEKREGKREHDDNAPRLGQAEKMERVGHVGAEIAVELKPRPVVGVRCPDAEREDDEEHHRQVAKLVHGVVTGR